MATCKNCGKPLIPYGGKCVYCGADVSGPKKNIKQKWFPKRFKHIIDLVFCVDCSGSMKPVINSIKQDVLSFVKNLDSGENEYFNIHNDEWDWRARVIRLSKF